MNKKILHFTFNFENFVFTLKIVFFCSKKSLQHICLLKQTLFESFTSAHDEDDDDDT